MTDQLPTADEFFGQQPQGQQPAASFDELMERHPPPKYIGGVVPLTGAGWDDYFTQAPAARVLRAFGQGAADGWGSQPIGLSPEAEKWLRDNGQFNDYEAGRTNLFRSFNEALIRPLAAGLDVALRTGTAAFQATQAGVAEVGKEAGAPRLARDIAGTPEAFFGTPHPLGIPDPAVARDLGVIGKGEDGWLGTADQRAALDEAIKRHATPQEIAPETGAAAEAPKLEAAAEPAAPVQAETPPDIHTIARQIDPDTFREYDALAQRKETFQRWIQELGVSRDTAATADIDAQIAREQERAQSPSRQAQAVAEERLSKLQDQRDAALEEARSADSPDMARIRQQLQQTDYRMRDLAPDVTRAYAQAREAMPAEPAAEPVQAAEPPQPSVRAAEEAKPAEEPPVQPAPVVAEAPKAPPVDIAADVTQKLTAAGRPMEEAQAAAAIVAAHYEARATRLGTTAQELYSKEGPGIEARESGRKGETGRTILKDGRATIRLMRSADASTFMHETGHAWLEELDRDAKDERATPDVKKDVATVRDWLGAKEGEAFTRAQHEKFARGFEGYLMEGRAPSQALASVFAKFKGWLTQIYETVAKLRAPITDDIRDVFDRLIAGESERATIAPERETPKSVVAKHEELAETTPPDKAQQVANQILAEWTARLREKAPERADELEGRTEGGASGGTGPGAEADRNGPPGRSDAGGTGGGAGGGAVGQGRGEAAPQGAGSGVGTAVIERARPTEPPAGPHDTFATAESKLVDKAGNIRLDNLNTPADVSQVIRDAAERNNEFTNARRGTISDAQVLDLADALGMDARKLNRRRLGQAFNAEQIMAARKLLIQSAAAVRDAAAKAAEGSEADLIAFGETQAKHRMIQEQVSGITAEAGRALRAFREIEGAKEASAIGEMVQEATGQTLYQLRRQAKAMSALNTTAQVGRQAIASAKPGFWDMFIEYFVNNLISGPATHVTYSVGNTVLALTKAIPETAFQAAIGAAREHILGDTGPRVYFGEIGAQLKAINQAGNPLITAAKLAKIFRDAPDAATARADAYALLRGSRDGVMAAARAAIDGTTAALPGEGVIKGLSPMVAPNKAIPNFEYVTRGGKTVPIPLGEAVRLPSRGVAVIHSYFRAVGYEQNLARLAYRAATEEGLDGNAFAARVADLRQSPPEAMMKEAVGEATGQTLMGKGGAVTRALTMLSNSRPLGVPLPKLINPFVHIVGNVLEQGLEERTPLGLADQEIRDNLMGRNGPIKRDTQISRMAVGTAVGLTGFGLAMEGLQNGSGPADPRQAALYRRVNGPANSTRIGDFWYDLHRLGVVAVPFTLGANIYETAHLMSNEDFSHAIAQVAFGVSKTILDESAMRGPSEFIRAVYDPTGYGARYVRSELTSALVPYSVGMGQEARAIDPYARRVTDMTEAFKAKVPWWSETLFPLRDWRGEPIPSREALGIDGLSAIYEEKARNDPTEQAMLRLGFYPSLAPKKIRGVELTEQQYDDYSRISGRMAGMQIDRIVSDPNFATLPEGVQRELMVKAMTGAREAASAAIMMENPKIVADATKAKLDRLSGQK